MGYCALGHGIPSYGTWDRGFGLGIRGFGTSGLWDLRHCVLGLGILGFGTWDTGLSDLGYWASIFRNWDSGLVILAFGA